MVLLSKTEASNILGISPTNFSPSTKAKWQKALTPDGKVDMSIAKQIKKEKELNRLKKRFVYFLKHYKGFTYPQLNNFIGYKKYTNVANFTFASKRVDSLIKAYPTLWQEFLDVQRRSNHLQ